MEIQLQTLQKYHLLYLYIVPGAFPALWHSLSSHKRSRNSQSIASRQTFTTRSLTGCWQVADRLLTVAQSTPCRNINYNCDCLQLSLVPHKSTICPCRNTKNRLTKYQLQVWPQKFVIIIFKVFSHIFRSFFEKNLFLQSFPDFSVISRNKRVSREFLDFSSFSCK